MRLILLPAVFLCGPGGCSRSWSRKSRSRPKGAPRRADRSRKPRFCPQSIGSPQLRRDVSCGSSPTVTEHSSQGCLRARARRRRRSAAPAPSSPLARSVSSVSDQAGAYLSLNQKGPRRRSLGPREEKQDGVARHSGGALMWCVPTLTPAGGGRRPCGRRQGRGARGFPSRTPRCSRGSAGGTGSRSAGCVPTLTPAGGGRRPCGRRQGRGARGFPSRTPRCSRGSAGGTGSRSAG